MTLVESANENVTAAAPAVCAWGMGTNVHIVPRRALDEISGAHLNLRLRRVEEAHLVPPVRRPGIQTIRHSLVSSKYSAKNGLGQVKNKFEIYRYQNKMVSLATFDPLRVTRVRLLYDSLLQLLRTPVKAARHCGC